MSGSIYQVGVHLSAHDGISGVLANISKSLLGLHGGVEHLNRGFASLQVGVLGAAAVAAGVKIGHVVENLVEHGFELKHWQAQLSAAGFTAQQVAGATARAWEVAGKNMNTTAAENLKNILELNKATGDLSESMKLLPTFAAAENVIASVKSTDIHSKLTSNSTQTLNFARGLEELGVTQMGKTPEEREANIKKYAAEYIKTMVSSKGLFDGNALYAMTNNSGGAAQNWDMRMATAVAPILGDIMKASKLGNADYMAIRSYQGGHITSEAAKALVENHLARLGGENDADADVYQDTKGYHLKANSHFAAGMETNLWDWSAKILERLKASGIDVTDQKKMNGIINEIGSNKSTSMMMRALMEPLTRLQIEKELKMRDQVGGNAAGALAGEDPWQKLDALHKKWTDFLTALGGPLVAPAIHALDVMTKGINQAAQYLVKNPQTAELISKTLVGLSVGLTALGSVLIGGAIVAAIGPAGWFVVGVTAVGVALNAVNPKAFGTWVDGFKQVMTGLWHMDWGEMKAGFAKEFTGMMQFLPGKVREGLDKLWTGIKNFDFGGMITGIRDTWVGAFKALPQGLQDACKTIVSEIGQWPGRLGAAIKDMGKSLVEKIGDELKSLASKIGGFFGGIFHTSFDGGGTGGGGFIKASYGDGRILPMGGRGDPNASGVTRAGGGDTMYDAIMRAEIPNSKHPYSETLGYGAYGNPGDLTKMTLAQVYAASEAIRRNPRNRTNAGPMGAFQILGSTMMAAARALGYDPKTTLFDASHQQQMARWIATHQGLGAWEGLKVHPREMAAARRANPNRMPGPPPRKHETIIHSPIHLDGKVVAQNTTRHQAREGMFPTAVGGIDGYGSFASPGTPLIDAA